MDEDNHLWKIVGKYVYHTLSQLLGMIEDSMDHANEKHLMIIWDQLNSTADFIRDVAYQEAMK